MTRLPLMPHASNPNQPASPLQIAGRKHIPALDGLRGVAILMVLAIHFYPKGIIAETYPTLTLFLGRFVSLGSYGVELFFVLSGFLITGILLETKSESGFLRKFYARRVLRIFPLYYGSLIVLLLILPRFVNLDAGAAAIVDRQLWLWTYMANWSTGWIWDDSTLFLLGHFWSLCVEEHFYLVWPLVVASLPSKRMFQAALGMVFLGMASRSISLVAGRGVLPIFDWATLQNLDGLAVGSLIAIALRSPAHAACIPNPAMLHRFATGLGVVSLAYVLLPRRLHHPALDVLGLTVIVLFFGSIVLIALRISPDSKCHRFLTSNALTTFGKYSYGLYVIHGILRPAFSKWFDTSSLTREFHLPLVYFVVYYVLTIGISLFFAYLSFQFFEKHFLNLKRFFEYQTPHPKAASPLTVVSSTAPQ